MIKKRSMKLFFSALSLLSVAATADDINTHLKLELGKTAPLLVLDGEVGEKLNGGGWNSRIIGGKVTVIMYVDPDNEKDNRHVEEQIQANFSKQDIKVFGIVNADSTFIPNFMLRRRLSSKQSHNELLTIVMDYQRQVEKVWGLKDERYNVMAFDKEGKLFFIRQGKLNSVDLKQLIDGLKSNVELSVNS